MRIPYGFILASDGVLNINKDEADVISMIFDFYIAGASLGKIVDTEINPWVEIVWDGRKMPC